jgi:hypothetical protein
MSIDYMFFDFREEQYTSMFRIWAIAEVLACNSKGRSVLTLNKAQLVDLIVKNPSLFRRACEFLSGKGTARTVGDVLYSTHVDRSHRVRQKDFLTKVLFLQEDGVVELVRKEEDYYLRCIQPLPVSDDESLVHLKSQLLAIKSILGKSDAIIEKMILGAE